jgi:hypothetical protein
MTASGRLPAHFAHPAVSADQPPPRLPRLLPLVRQQLDLLALALHRCLLVDFRHRRFGEPVRSLYIARNALVGRSRRRIGRPLLGAPGSVMALSPFGRSGFGIFA